jgi:hypothetical protein
MNMADIHMVEGMDMVEKRSSNHWSEDAGTDIVEERPLNPRPEVEGIDRENIDMV